MLVIDGLVHRFAGRSGEAPAAIDIAGLTVPTGEFAVITGPSGSGKSTLLYLLSGLLLGAQGCIAWDGVDIAGLSEVRRDTWRRQHAGFVFQNFNLIEEMSALENVVVAAHFSAFSAGIWRERARLLLEQFGIPAGTRSVSTYSRGEQQRIALARALLFDPPILFADEPSASLDTDNALALRAQLEAVVATGKTVLVVSHDPILIEAAQRVIRLDHGRLIFPTQESVA